MDRATYFYLNPTQGRESDGQTQLDKHICEAGGKAVGSSLQNPGLVVCFPVPT